MTPVFSQQLTFGFSWSGLCTLTPISAGFWRALHSPAAPATQPVLDTEEDKAESNSDSSNPAGRQLQQSNEASTFADAARSTAEACDVMLGSLQQAKSKASLSKHTSTCAVTRSQALQDETGSLES